MVQFTLFQKLHTRGHCTTSTLGRTPASLTLSRKVQALIQRQLTSVTVQEGMKGLFRVFVAEKHLVGATDCAQELKSK